ncbi:MAG: cytochrome-c oxidase, cbb3-type subunit I [Leptospiraceae bacterium]|nr:cytochrome-c oxidase, cbb3-type subunit I [Leptospiraceae bacterium]
MSETQAKYNDFVVKGFVISAVVWGITAMLVGVIAATQLVIPELNLGIPFTSFGRLRPLHTNAAIFGFALSAVFAAVYYSLQRVLRVRLFSDKLATIHLVLYNLTIVGAAVTLLGGFSQSKEYAELEWPLDILIAVWWVIFAINFFGTIAIRKEKQLYVAIWFYMATVITVPILFIGNNMVVPVSLFKSYSVYSGVFDANVQWWYGHNAVAFVLTTPFLGLMYYFFPKHINQPVYSHRLSIVHFWSLIFIYLWAGPHHLLYSPLPDWAQSLGTAFSIMLILPSWGGMLNGFLTLTQAKEKVQTDAIVKFFLVGITFYGMSTFEGPMMSIKTVNSLSHFNDWTIGHVHSGALGWVGFMSIAMIYFLIPRLFGKKLYSEKLANVHFWLGTLGILAYVISMWISGVTEGAMWRAIDETGALQYPNWVTITEVLWIFRAGRAVGGLMYLTGMIVMAYNIIMTVKKGEPASVAA